jgi:hypothetical protein
MSTDLVTLSSLGLSYYIYQWSKLIVLILVVYILWRCQIVVQVIMDKIGLLSATPFRYQDLIIYIILYETIFYIFMIITIPVKWILLGKVKSGKIHTSYWRKWRIWC